MEKVASFRIHFWQVVAAIGLIVVACCSVSAIWYSFHELLGLDTALDNQKGTAFLGLITSLLFVFTLLTSFGMLVLVVLGEAVVRGRQKERGRKLFLGWFIPLIGLISNIAMPMEKYFLFTEANLHYESLGVFAFSVLAGLGFLFAWFSSRNVENG